MVRNPNKPRPTHTVTWPEKDDSSPPRKSYPSVKAAETKVIFAHAQVWGKVTTSGGTRSYPGRATNVSEAYSGLQKGRDPSTSQRSPIHSYSELFQQNPKDDEEPDSSLDSTAPEKGSRYGNYDCGNTGTHKQARPREVLPSNSTHPTPTG